MKRTGTKLAMTVSLLALAGCSTLQPPVRQIAVDSNRVFAESADQQTFLNILRAKDKVPMHFSSFAFFRGNLEVRTTAGLGGSLVERGTQTVTNNVSGTNTIAGTVDTLSNGVDTFTPSLGISTASNPNFEVNVYDSKQFQNGILTPIAPSLIDFFLNQGWPDQFLSALFISNATIKVEKLEDKNKQVPSVGPQEGAQTDDAKTAQSGAVVKADDQNQADTRSSTDKEKKAEKFEFLMWNDPVIATDKAIEEDPAKEKYDFGKFIQFFQLLPHTQSSSERPLAAIGDIEDFSLGDIGEFDGSKFSVRSYSQEELDELDAKFRNNCKPDKPCVVSTSKSSRTVSVAVRNGAAAQDLSNRFIPFPKGKLRKEITAALGLKRDSSLFISCKDFSVTPDGKSLKTDAKKDACIISKDDRGKEEAAKLSLEVVFRSPQAVIYYLGSYLRERKDKDTEVYEIFDDALKKDANGNFELDKDGNKQPCRYKVIQAKPKFGENDLIKVRHRGENWAMEDPESNKCAEKYHRGTQAMALVQQLINLHKSSDDLPSTRALQIVP